MLVIDCALPLCRVALLDGSDVLAERELEARHGQAALLPGLVAELLAAHGRSLDRIVANVGPGSFTGLRAALSLAHGLALASGAALVGVTGGEALAGVATEGRALWVATPARAGRVFLERGGVACSAPLDALPAAEGPVLVAGAAAAEVALLMQRRGDDVRAGACAGPDARALAAAAQRRVEGALPPRAVLPLYVDAPEASLPRGGLRPGPA
ncbi:MAG: tRNA (adenosine(37)-N6)-threonylcarbamoyltransferase complex dimerization subunit type 1 TsaB [Janthinobacterium lividum]